MANDLIHSILFQIAYDACRIWVARGNKKYRKVSGRYNVIDFTPTLSGNCRIQWNESPKVQES